MTTAAERLTVAIDALQRERCRVMWAEVSPDAQRSIRASADPAELHLTGGDWWFLGLRLRVTPMRGAALAYAQPGKAGTQRRAVEL